MELDDNHTFPMTKLKNWKIAQLILFDDMIYYIMLWWLKQNLRNVNQISEFS